MKNFFLLSLLFASSIVYCQNADDSKIKPTELVSDSALLQHQRILDSINRSSAYQQNMDRNMNYILELQTKQKEKQKKAAMVRIAIGVALLVVLIIGLRRRTKK